MNWYQEEIRERPEQGHGAMALSFLRTRRRRGNQSERIYRSVTKNVTHSYSFILIEFALVVKLTGNLIQKKLPLPLPPPPHVPS